MTNTLPPRIPAELLDRYFTGRCTPDEMAQVEAAIAQNPKLASLQHEVQGVPVDVTSLWARFSAAHGIRNTHGTGKTPTIRELQTPERGRRRGTELSQRNTIRAYRGWLTFTGAMAVAIIAIVAGMHRFNTDGDASTSPTIYSTRNAQRADVELPDGTRVTLNAASRLEVPRSFGARNRTVRLTGEAYFRVAHTERTAFVVEANGMQAHVLGTEFDVRAYEPQRLRVAVRTGRVAVGRTVLNANDIAYTKQGELLVSHDQTLDDILGFVNGRLVFQNVPLREAIADLNRWYDADVQLADPSLGDRPFNAICMPGSPAELADLLRLAFRGRVVRTGRTLIVSSSGS